MQQCRIYSEDSREYDNKDKQIYCNLQSHRGSLNNPYTLQSNPTLSIIAIGHTHKKEL